MIDKFIEQVCSEFNISRQTLISDKRNRDIVDLRFVCYYVISTNNPGITRRVVGRYFNKNHSTVYHGIQEIGNLKNSVPYLRDLVEKVDRIYKALLILRKKNSTEYKKLFERNIECKRAYIAGKITGLDYDKAVDIFNEAEKELSEKGYEVINPVKISPFSQSKEWHDYMFECIPALMTCDVIYLLSNWGQSRGARIEYAIAREMGIDIKFQN